MASCSSFYSSELPINFIDQREKMYENIKDMLSFIFNYCEDQENNIGETSVVSISLLKVDNQNGALQIDVDGSWLKTFNIRTFLIQCTERDKMYFYLIYYGNEETDSYYLYEVRYDSVKETSKTILKVDKEKKIDKPYYLRIVIKSKISFLNSCVEKIKDFLKTEAPKYPNVNIQFDRSLFKIKNTDVDAIEMICEGFSDILQYSLNLNFRRTIFESLNVTTKEQASREISKLLEDQIGINMEE